MGKDHIMSKKSVAKSPRHVKAGQARHAKLREQLGEDGYRAYQRQAGAASEAHQRAQGAEVYQANKRRGYVALVAKHGVEIAKQALQRGRAWRVDNPTEGEASMRQALRDAGYTVHEDAATIVDGCASDVAYTLDDVIREAQVGPYFVDFLVPAQRLVIEVDGGCHQLRQEQDARRDAAIRAAGFRVVRIATEAASQSPAAAEFIFRVLI
jgi:hypothetical protein